MNSLIAHVYLSYSPFQNLLMISSLKSNTAFAFLLLILFFSTIQYIYPLVKEICHALFYFLASDLVVPINLFCLVMVRV